MSQFPRIKVLIVDDDYPAAWTGTIKRYLEDTGEFVVFTENDARMAIEVAMSLKPDVILVDMAMNTIDGGELMELFASNSALDGAALLYVTGQVAEKADAKWAHGVQGRWRFFTKDEEPENLIARIANLFLLKFKYGNKSGVPLSFQK